MPHLRGPFLQELSTLTNLTSLDLSGNSLGIYGMHLVNSIRIWGPDHPLEELDLSHCQLPASVSGPLLSVLGRCKKLKEIWLPGNTLTGCLHQFLSSPTSQLPFLEELFLSYTELNHQDLLHLCHLIQEEKIPELKELDLGANGLDKNKKLVERLVETCVTHHQVGLKINTWFNNLSRDFNDHLKQLSTGFAIEVVTE